MGTARAGRASGARDPAAAHHHPNPGAPPAPLLRSLPPPTPGPATPTSGPGHRVAREAPPGAGPSPCWQWEEFEAAPGQVASSAAAPSLGEFIRRGAFRSHVGCRGLRGKAWTP